MNDKTKENEEREASLPNSPEVETQYYAQPNRLCEEAIVIIEFDVDEKKKKKKKKKKQKSVVWADTLPNRKLINITVFPEKKEGSQKKLVIAFGIVTGVSVLIIVIILVVLKILEVI
jgi:hypothetical protein